MKFALKLLLFAGMAFPSAAFGMDSLLTAIANRRGPHSPRDGNDSMESSLENSFLLPHEDTARTHEANQIDLAEAMAKADALGHASDANKALQSAADKFITLSRLSAPKAPKSNPHEKARGIKHSDSAINLHDVTNDEEWGDGISTAPALPPFEPQPTSSNPSDDDAPANNNAPQAAIVPAKRPLPAPPVPPRDDEPLIEEMPEPMDEAPPVPKRDDLSPDEQENSDFTQIREPQSGGVREERHAQDPKKPRAKTAARPNSKTRPLPPAPNAGATTHSSAPSSFAKASKDKMAGKPGAPKGTSTLSAPNLIISAGLLGLLTWLENSLEGKPLSPARKQAIAQEVTSAAQQTAAANIAQQLLPGTSANSFAFTATFMLLHACEVGLKHLATKVLATTKGGKKITTAYKKMSAKKRKVLDGAGTFTGWLAKTLLARAMAR